MTSSVCRNRRHKLITWQVQGALFYGSWVRAPNGLWYHFEVLWEVNGWWWTIIHSHRGKPLCYIIKPRWGKKGRCASIDLLSICHPFGCQPVMAHTCSLTDVRIIGNYQSLTNSLLQSLYHIQHYVP